MKKARAFTMIELLLSMTIISIVLVTATSMLSTSLNQLRVAEGGFGQFQETMAAFESMTNRLSTCQINPYYDYEYHGSVSSGVPKKYSLHSDLHFVCGPTVGGSYPLLAGGSHPTHGVFFHGTYGVTQTQDWLPLGGLLNSWGYFIEFGSDQTERASFLSSSGVSPRYRFRLKELQVPAEDLKTYAIGLKKSSTLSPGSGLYDWFRQSAANPQHSRTLAENIIALVITPLTTLSNGTLSNELAPNYFYDSRNYLYNNTLLAERTRHRLPPMLRITMVALDEASASRLEEENSSSMPELGLNGLFQNASQYQNDLATLEQTLNDRKLRYRIFSSTIRLRNARWTNTY